MDAIPQGPYANVEKAPLLIQKCSCPLYCMVHGENGPIPGDMKTQAQKWEGLEVRRPGTQPAYLGGPQQFSQTQSTDTVVMGPPPVGADGVIGAVPDPSAPMQWQPVQAPITPLSTYQTPAAIIPVEIENAQEILDQAGLKVVEYGEQIAVEYWLDGERREEVGFNYEVANALCQEILKARKRIELTLPETLETTMDALKKRLGPDMAPLADLIKKALTQNPSQG